LIDLYFKSVGRNSLLLLNVPPNDEGLVSESDVKRLAEFRAKLDEIFKTDLAAGKKATASNTRENDKTFAAVRALDGNPDTYWATDDDQTSGWIEVDLGSPTTFNIACLQEAIALGQRVESYAVEYWDGSAWKTISKGTTIGHKKLDRFEPVTAQRVRLVVDKSLACPTISTFGLYNAR
jgi:alpha-L-fucosidase